MKVFSDVPLDIIDHLLIASIYNLDISSIFTLIKQGIIRQTENAKADCADKKVFIYFLSCFPEFCQFMFIIIIYAPAMILIGLIISTSSGITHKGKDVSSRQSLNIDEMWL